MTVEPGQPVVASSTTGGDWTPPNEIPLAACNGPAVGFAVVRGIAAITDGSALSGTVSVETRCGTVSGSLTAGFDLTQTDSSGPLAGVPRYSYTAPDSSEILRVPLYQLDDVLSVELQMSAAGFPRAYHDFFSFGCRTGIAQDEQDCVDASPHAIKGGSLRTSFEIEGRATWLQQVWPDTVACGTETVLPVLAIKPGGAEGYVELDQGLMSVKRTGSGRLTVAGEYVSSATTTNDNAEQIWYPNARDGGIVYTALACDRVAAPYTVNISVKGPGTNGYYRGHGIRVLPPPPVALHLAPTRDTLDAGAGWAWIPVTAVLEDGSEAYFKNDEPITYTSSGPPGTFRTLPNAPDGSMVLTPTATLLYNQSVNGSRKAHNEGVIFLLTSEERANPPVCDTDVSITATGGGVSGEATVVVRGSSAATTPTNLIVTVEPGILVPGETAAVRVEAVTTDGCDVRDDVIPMETPMEVTLSADIGVLIYGGQQGLGLTVPYGALRGGEVTFEAASTLNVLFPSGPKFATVVASGAGLAGSAGIEIGSVCEAPAPSRESDSGENQTIGSEARVAALSTSGPGAWPITRSWDAYWIGLYRAYAKSRGEQYVNILGQRRTCEDLALSILIDFAKLNGLPVVIVNESCTHSSSSSYYSSAEEFENHVLARSGANDLGNHGNTVPVSAHERGDAEQLEFAQRGDMILMDQWSPDTFDHVQVVISNENGEIEIVQGNTNESLTGSSDPVSCRYVGTVPEEATWQSDGSYKPPSTPTNSIPVWVDGKFSDTNSKVVSWNFSRMNNHDQIATQCTS